MRLLNFTLAFFSSQFLLAQYTAEIQAIHENKPLSEYSRVITSYELWEEILFSKDTLLEYDNVFILADEIQSARLDSLFTSRLVWEIEPQINISNSNFGRDYLSYGYAAIFKLERLTFKRTLDVYACEGAPEFVFRNCDFREGFSIYCQTYIVQILNSKIRGRFSVGNVNYGNCANNLLIDSCDIEFMKDGFPAFALGVNSNAGEDFRIWITNSKFHTDDAMAYLYLTEFEELYIANCIFSLPVFIQSDKLERFTGSNSSFQRISFYSFPDALDFMCRWSVLKGVLANDDPDDRNNWHLDYFDGRNNELSDIEPYDELISKYKTLHEIYKTRGDMLSANGCYMEMKDLETKRLLYIYETQGGINHYFNYKLNVWLGKFADYGTNPVKCILYAINVILFFAFFYLLFYSKWDNINNKFMLKRSQTFIHFFKAEQKREEIYTDSYKEHIYSFEDFKKSVQEAKGQIPFFFFLFLRPVYWTARRKIIINEWFYNRLDFTRKSWASLTKKQRLGYGTFYFSALMIYGLYLLTIKFLTALIISFNSFSSLGFGSLNLSGVTRYLAMVEGFVGWLLLSVFSISLFSQIIQG